MIIKASFSCYHKFNGAKQEGRSERGNPSFISLSDPLARFPTQFFEVDSIWFSVTNWNGPRDQKQIDYSDSSNRKRLETIFFPEGYPMKNSPGGLGDRLTFKKVILVILRIFSLKGPPEMAFAFTFQRIGCKKVNVSWYLALELVPLRSEKKVKPHLQNRLAGTS